MTPDKVDSVIHPSTPNDSTLSFSELKIGSESSQKLKKHLDSYSKFGKIISNQTKLKPTFTKSTK